MQALECLFEHVSPMSAQQFLPLGLAPLCYEHANMDGNMELALLIPAQQIRPFFLFELPSCYSMEFECEGVNGTQNNLTLTFLSSPLLSSTQIRQQTLTNTGLLRLATLSCPFLWERRGGKNV